VGKVELSFPLGITGFVLHRTKFYPRQKPAYRFPVVSVSVESKNEKSECVNENENKKKTVLTSYMKLFCDKDRRT